MLAYFLYVGSFTGVAEVAVPSIFIAFAINFPLHWLGTKYFRTLGKFYKICLNDEKRIFKKHEELILASKYLMYKDDIEGDVTDSQKLNTIPGWSFMVYCYFAKNYDSVETSIFRLPKSFGVMCFNFFIVSFAVPTIFLITQVLVGGKINDFHVTVIGLSLFLSLFFLLSATQFMKDALTKQLNYWGSISLEDFKKIVHYYHLQKNL